MKHSICNIQLLPKAADLRKKALMNFVLIWRLFSRNAKKSWQTSSSFLIPSFPGPRVFIAWRRKRKRDDQKEQRGTDYIIRKVMVFILFYSILNNIYSGGPSSTRLVWMGPWWWKEKQIQKKVTLTDKKMEAQSEAKVLEAQFGFNLKCLLRPNLNLFM